MLYPEVRAMMSLMKEKVRILDMPLSRGNGETIVHAFIRSIRYTGEFKALESERWDECLVKRNSADRIHWQLY
jgi:hypothetical protein